MVILRRHLGHFIGLRCFRGVHIWRSLQMGEAYRRRGLHFPPVLPPCQQSAGTGGAAVNVYHNGAWSRAHPT